MTISVWSMFWGWGLAWRASWALPSDLEIKAPWLHSHGPRRQGGVGGASTSGSRLEAQHLGFISVAERGGVGIVDRLLAQGALSRRRRLGHERVDAYLFRRQDLSFDQDTEQKLPSYQCQASTRGVGGLTTATPCESRCLRPTMDFVSRERETVEKKAPRRQNARALSICAHGGGLAVCRRDKQQRPLKMAAVSQAFIPRCVTPPSSLGQGIAIAIGTQASHTDRGRADRASPSRQFGGGNRLTP